MKATVLALGVALGALVAASPARAQPCYCPTPPVYWDPYSAAVYEPNCYGQWYGPNVYLYPPFAPFQGMVFPPPQRPGAPGMPGNGGFGFGGPVAFPSHQWARSPRDFFMYDP